MDDAADGEWVEASATVWCRHGGVVQSLGDLAQSHPLAGPGENVFDDPGAQWINLKHRSLDHVAALTSPPLRVWNLLQLIAVGRASSGPEALGVRLLLAA